MNRTKIEWADYVWNPIKGLCPERCWYCYARRIYQRFGLDPRLSYGGTPGGLLKMKPAKIFVCSTMELFHPKIPMAWRDAIFAPMYCYPKHTFIILTKRPDLIDRPMPRNVWLGVSVTGMEDWYRVEHLRRSYAFVKFVSLEPFYRTAPHILAPRIFDWLIVGRMTGHGFINDPDPEKIRRIVREAKELKIPVFLKNNLKNLWDGKLIQEYPR